MKFSTQEEYGLRCLLAIAKSETADLTIPKIARLESLSEPHVAKLLMILRKADFVRSTRGHTGGYSLARPADQIIIGDVLAVLGGRIYEGSFCDRHSGLSTSCVHESSCYLGALWLELQDAIDKVLMNLTLAGLIERKKIPSPLRFGLPNKSKREPVAVAEA